MACGRFYTNKKRNPRVRKNALLYEALESRHLLATITVNTLVDELDGSIQDGDISLRDALAAANTGDAINFASQLDAGTIQLTLGELLIDRPLTIDATNLGNTITIDATASDPTPHIADGSGSRIFKIEYPDGNNASTSLAGLRLIGGDATGNGGAVYSKPPLIVADSFISGNDATGRGDGLYVYRGSLSLERTTISDNGEVGVWGHDMTIRDSIVTGHMNWAFESEGLATISDSKIMDNGGGVYAGNHGAVSVHRSTISGNGAAIWAYGGVTIADSTITNNRDAVRTGSYECWCGDITIRRSIITNNGGHGASSGGGSVTIEDSRISNNGRHGVTAMDSSTIRRSKITNNGGVGVSVGPWGGVTVNDSTISGNRSGGIRSTSALIENSTISENHSTYDGGGIHTESSLRTGDAVRIFNSTIVGNTSAKVGGGIWAEGAIVENSIIAGNSDDGTAPDIYAWNLIGRSTQPELIQYSLIGDNTGTVLQEAQVGSADIHGNFIGDSLASGTIDPMLSEIGMFGGSTPTHIPLPGSPVINAGNPVVGPEMSVDQRGEPFQRVADARVDMGAAESQTALVDFNSDAQLDCADVNELSGTILQQQHVVNHDLTGDSIVDDDDLDAWLSLAGVATSPNHLPFLRGDANLDGQVNHVDLIDIVAANWQKAPSGFCGGDLVVDGIIDAQDLNQIGLYWSPSSPIADQVMNPSPTSRRLGSPQQSDVTNSLIKTPTRTASYAIDSTSRLARFVARAMRYRRTGLSPGSARFDADGATALKFTDSVNSEVGNDFQGHAM